MYMPKEDSKANLQLKSLGITGQTEFTANKSSRYMEINIFIVKFISMYHQLPNNMSDFFFFEYSGVINTVLNLLQ